MAFAQRIFFYLKGAAQQDLFFLCIICVFVCPESSLKYKSAAGKGKLPEPCHIYQIFELDGVGELPAVAMYSVSHTAPAYKPGPAVALTPGKHNTVPESHYTILSCHTLAKTPSPTGWTWRVSEGRSGCMGVSVQLDVTYTSHANVLIQKHNSMQIVVKIKHSGQCTCSHNTKGASIVKATQVQSIYLDAV